MDELTHHSTFTCLLLLKFVLLHKNCLQNQNFLWNWNPAHRAPVWTITLNSLNDSRMVSLLGLIVLGSFVVVVSFIFLFFCSIKIDNSAFWTKSSSNRKSWLPVFAFSGFTLQWQYHRKAKLLKLISYCCWWKSFFWFQVKNIFMRKHYIW